MRSWVGLACVANQGFILAPLWWLDQSWAAHHMYLPRYDTYVQYTYLPTYVRTWFSTQGQQVSYVTIIPTFVKLTNISHRTSRVLVSIPQVPYRTTVPQARTARAASGFIQSFQKLPAQAFFLPTSFKTMSIEDHSNYRLVNFRA